MLRFVDDDGHAWTVRDVALLPERTLVDPGNAEAVERYFVSVTGEKRVYVFAEGESRLPAPAELECQLRGAQRFAPQRQSDPSEFRI